MESRTLAMTFGQGIGDNSAHEIRFHIELTGDDVSDQTLLAAAQAREAQIGARLDDLMQDVDDFSPDPAIWDKVLEAGYEPKPVELAWHPSFEVYTEEDEDEPSQVAWIDFALWWLVGDIPGLTWRRVQPTGELFAITKQYSVARAYAIEHVG